MKPVWLMQPIPYFGEKLEGVWIWEKKLDGWRMQIIKKEDGEVEFWGRRLEKKPNWTEKLRYLMPFIEKSIPSGTILDSELCAFKGRRFIPSLFATSPKDKPLIYVFDVIYLNKEFVGNLPLEKRKKILKEFNFKPPFYFLTFQKLKNIKEDFRKALSKNSEGMVIKKLDSFYMVGENAPIASLYWRKIK